MLPLNQIEPFNSVALITFFKVYLKVLTKVIFMHLGMNEFDCLWQPNLDLWTTTVFAKVHCANGHIKHTPYKHPHFVFMIHIDPLLYSLYMPFLIIIRYYYTVQTMEVGHKHIGKIVWKLSVEVKTCFLLLCLLVL